MRRFLIGVSVILCLLSTGCVSLFSEIHNETHHHHVNGEHMEEMEHRINELEEQIHHLKERLEEDGDFDEEEEEEER